MSNNRIEAFITSSMRVEEDADTTNMKAENENSESYSYPELFYV